MPIELLQGPLLSQRTTLRLGGRAIAEVVVKRKDDLAELPEVLKKLGGQPLVMGRGSNILAKSGELNLTLIKMDFAEPPVVIGEAGQAAMAGQDSQGVFLEVWGNTPLPKLLKFCAEHGLTGLQGLSGIPGQVGGAIAMNAGSYGQEIGDVLESITLFVPGQGIITLNKGDFVTSYRSFYFKGKEKAEYYLILSARLCMGKDKPEQIKLAMQEFKKIKAATQPLNAFSAGCAFCNPEPGISAGKILDELGFKGKSLGGMMFSDMHANFLVNTGQGDSAQALELLHMAKEKVLAERGLALKLEIMVYP